MKYNFKTGATYIVKPFETVGGQMLKTIDLSDLEKPDCIVFGDFEIKRKITDNRSAMDMLSDIGLRHKLDKMYDKIQESVLKEPESTPNCAVCKWHIARIDPQQRFTDHCEPQGFEDSRKVYNTPECKKLFEEREIKSGEAR